MRRFARLGMITLVLSGICASAQAAVSLGTTDTFDQGATQGWATGPNSPNPPVGVASGGPEGADDGYLLMSANGGVGAGARLITFAGPQWLGDYVAARVPTIRMDANNFGQTALALRLAFLDTNFATAFTTQAQTLPAGSGWTTLSFDIRPEALTGASSVLGSVAEIRLYHNPAPASFISAPNVAASLGIDNVSAVPEPQAWLLFGVGLAFVGSRIARRSRSRSSPL